MAWGSLLLIAGAIAACLGAGLLYVRLKFRRSGWQMLATPHSSFEIANAGGRQVFRLRDILIVCACLMICAVFLVYPRGTTNNNGSPFNCLPIRQLQGVRNGSTVQVQGVVTYRDDVLKLLWVQDETGGIAATDTGIIGTLKIGDSVVLEAQLETDSDGPVPYFLSNVRIKALSGPGKIPDAIPVNLRRLTSSGERVQVTGTALAVVRDQQGRNGVLISDSGPEVLVVLPKTPSESRVIDSRVRATGVVVRDTDGKNPTRYLVLSDQQDLVLGEAAPSTMAAHSVRSLYQQAKNLPAHRVLLHGTVSSVLSPTSIVVEDKWGRIRCSLASPSRINPGEQVEVSGFPTTDPPLIDLSHAVIRETSATATGPDTEPNPPVLTSIQAVRRLTEPEANEAVPAKISAVVTYNDARRRQMFVQDGDQAIYVKYAESDSTLHPGDRVSVTGLTNAGGYAPVIVAPKLVKTGSSPLPSAVAVNARSAASGSLDSQYVSLEGVVHPIKANEEASHITFELYSPLGQVHVYTSDSADEKKLHELEDATVRVQGVFGTVFNSRRQLLGYQLSLPSTKDIEVLYPAPTRPFDSSPVGIGTVLQFSAERTVGHRLKLEGVVTYTGKDFFYLQDDTGGIAVRSSNPTVRVGDLLDVVGYAAPQGRYSPVMTDTMIRPLNRVGRVTPKLVTAQSLVRGEYDSQLISLEGRLLGVVDTPDGANLVMQSGAVPFTAKLEGKEPLAPNALRPGSTVRVTGICALQVDQQKLYLLFGQEPVTFSVLMRSPRDAEVTRAPSWWDWEQIRPFLALLAAVVVLAMVWVAILRRRIRNQSEELTKAAETAQAIRDLSVAMNDVSSRQDLTARVSVRGSEQIAQLVVGFNNMLGELEHRDQAKRAAELKLHQQAVTDELTGLPNRRLFTDRLTQSVELARRQQSLVAVLYVDLDGFKLVNDSLGHTAGDKLLSEVSQRLRSRIRKSDTLARLGGDEFSIVLSGCKKKEDAEFVANMVLNSLSAPFWVEGHEIRVGASIGVSFFPDDATTAADLLQQSDSAMYAAKRNGKNRVMFFTQELGVAVRERLTLEGQLRNALANGQISVHYQPEFDLKSGRLVRFEALARWIDPVLGTIAPARFIPVAEETGLIGQLGAYVMERACVEAKKWQVMVDEPVQVAVNVSTIEFTRDSFVQDVADVLQRTGLRPDLLQIELTESAMVTGVDHAAQAIQQLRAFGVTVAIDDFGTGYSCLSYLPRLSFDALKIDRSFVRELPERPEIAAMVHSLVTLAHNLKMKVIVEGVETEQQLQAVSEIGGNEVQGFLLGRPTADPLEHLELWRNGMLRAPRRNIAEIEVHV